MAEKESNDSQSGAITESARKLSLALAQLESAVNTRLEREIQLLDAEAEVQRMGADRSRLAESLDAAQSRAQRLESTNREVSNRLIGAMESIRAVLDGES
jgi:cell division septum initiation protein DivIVA